MADWPGATWRRWRSDCRRRCTKTTCSTASAPRHTWVSTLPPQGVPIVQPPGGHAIYLDARAFLPHIPPEQFPGVSLAAELYLEGGIRSVEIGTLMFGAAAKMDLVRLAIPRRVYTQSHIDYVVEVILEVWRRREQIRGLRLSYEAPFLRHFTAKLEPLEKSEVRGKKSEAKAAKA